MPNNLTKSLSTPNLDTVKEQRIISSVADKYGLKGNARNLLFAIRNAENGAQGKEFGVLNPEAMRFAKDPDPYKSLEIQAMWAAGTIKKRFDGDLEKFSKIYAPKGVDNDPNNLNANWLKNVSYYMKQTE